MKNLSIIMTALNEGDEVENTIKGIKETAGESVDVILVNDASTDGYDYKSVATKYGINYIENSVRKGCAKSREIAIKHCKTPYFFIIDSHMRFYNNSWNIQIENALISDQRSIYCLKCKPWDYETKTEKDQVPGFAAYLKLVDPKVKGVLDPSWIVSDIFLLEESDIVKIPVVLGACYAASKDYWNYLKGLTGLVNYGCDEAYISIKAWMEGGGCKLLKNVEIGHLFRTKFPYTVNNIDILHNKLLITLSLLPEDIGRRIIRAMKVVDYPAYTKAKELLKEDEVIILSDYYKVTFKKGYENFSAINESIINRL